MDSVFILSGETGEALVEHQCAGSRRSSASGSTCVEDLWQEILRNKMESTLANGSHEVQQVPTVIALPQCYVFHVRSDPLIFGCATQREVSVARRPRPPLCSGPERHLTTLLTPLLCSAAGPAPESPRVPQPLA